MTAQARPVATTGPARARRAAGRAESLSGVASLSAIGKVAAVVQALADEHRLTEISRATSLPTSTVHRILHELVELGWAREDGERGYLLGSRLLSLAGRASEETTVARVARSFLRELCLRTGHTVHLAVRQGDEAVYIDKLEGRRPAYRMRSRVGVAVPLHCTAIGKAVLASLTKEEVRLIAGRTGLPRHTGSTITDVGKLIGHLRQVRERGFAVDNEENELQTRCIGAVVMDHRNVPIGGLSVSSLVFDLDDERVRHYAPLTTSTARELSTALGSTVYL